MQTFGLSANQLTELNPRLIYASLSGFGHSGLDTDRAAYDVIIQAMSGLMSVTGEGPGRFVRVGTSISDILTGMFGAVAILAAVRDRDQTGKGTIIDLAMLDCTVAALENAISRFAVSGRSPEPLGTRHPSITPFQAFETADDPIVVAAGNDGLWRKLCEVLGCIELVDERRLATNDARTENRDYLEEQLTSQFQQRPQSHWLARLSEAGVPAAPIRNMEQVASDRHLASRGMLHSMQDGSGGHFLTAGSPFRINDQPPSLSDRSPNLGEDTQSILREWLDES